MSRPLISADSHLCEPPELWTSRLPRRYQERAPRVVNLDGRPGEYFVCEDIQPRSVYAASAAGVPSEELPRRAALGFAAAPPSVWDPRARLAEQDVDGVAAEVLFPTFADLLFGCQDAEFRRACLHAYNDFVAEYCAVDPNRLVGTALVDDADPGLAAEEVTRAAGLGLRGVVLRADPDRSYADASFDPVWETAVGLDLPVVIHRGAVRRDITIDVHGALLDYVMIPAQAQRALTALVFGGVWERYPGLRLILCEFDLLWIPHFLQRLEHADHRFGRSFGVDLSRPALDQVTDGVWVTFQHETDEVPRILPNWSAERLMWASDYPHADSTWPHSVGKVAELRAAVGPDTTTMLTHDTVSRLFGLRLPAPAPSAPPAPPAPLEAARP
ncbi:Amidohydrolase [Frankia torreyi]|uniref:Amidohydrolase n=1 Tax=Frankia torreyi TaxID=1856 RepID=A0A0D8BCA8_9ACTN|nr:MULTISPECIES: amidohydrolase family protein [Frankia]KJE21027.1 Amidohydrolase [Frankia torreyi]KQC35933.1 aminocarboxymuconate-semialdehyde decarboxylase [Frankia sp. ACN1ag]